MSTFLGAKIPNGERVKSARGPVAGVLVDRGTEHGHEGELFRYEPVVCDTDFTPPLREGWSRGRWIAEIDDA